MTTIASKPFASRLPRVTRPARPPGSPTRPRNFHARDVAVLIGAVVSSFSLTWLLYSQILPLSGLQGFILCWVASFEPIYYLAVREIDGPIVARDRAMGGLIAIVALAIVIPLAIIVVYVTVKGVAYLRPSFFTDTMAEIGPQSPPEQSGGLHAIIGTVQQVGIALLISVPLGILTAVYLNEVKGRLRRPVRIFVDAMSGVPSIVAGLFIFTVLIAEGGTFSGFAAALALSILMLPTVTRTTEVVLRLVPDGLREASLAMGSSEWRTVWRVVLPTARSGVITAIILGIARVVGETAPLIMTAFGNPAMNANPFTGAQDALPLAAFRLFRGFENDVLRAWTFAFVLIALVLILFVLARRFSRRQFGR